MFSADTRNAAIVAFQRQEILRLADCSESAAQQQAMRPHYSKIGEWFPSGMGGKVLEIGCGPGRYVALLSALGYEVVGADPAVFPLWDEIKERRRVEFLTGVRVESLPFEDGVFDHVACLGALLYFEDPERALAEIKRVLKPGGRLFMRTVNRENMFRKATGKNIDPASKNFYTEQELADFLNRAGFDVSKTSSYGFFPPFLSTTWWYLVNGKIPLFLQELISAITPRRHRVNVSALAVMRVD